MDNTTTRPSFPISRLIYDDDACADQCRACGSSIYRIFDFFIVKMRDPKRRCINPKCNNHHPKVVKKT